MMTREQQAKLQSISAVGDLVKLLGHWSGRTAGK
jgi:hypothetical protein